jgi:hypothetical protein
MATRSFNSSSLNTNILQKGIRQYKRPSLTEASYLNRPQPRVVSKTPSTSTKPDNIDFSPFPRVQNLKSRANDSYISNDYHSKSRTKDLHQETESYELYSATKKRGAYDSTHLSPTNPRASYEHTRTFICSGCTGSFKERENQSKGQTRGDNYLSVNHSQ